MSERETSPAGRPSTFSPRRREFKLGDRPYKGYLSQDCDFRKKLFICAVLIMYLRTFQLLVNRDSYRVSQSREKISITMNDKDCRLS